MQQKKACLFLENEIRGRDLVLYSRTLPVLPEMQVFEHFIALIDRMEKSARVHSRAVAARRTAERVLLRYHFIFGLTARADIRDVLRTGSNCLALKGSGILAKPVIFVVSKVFQHHSLEFVDCHRLYFLDGIRFFHAALDAAAPDRVRTPSGPCHIGTV